RRCRWATPRSGAIEPVVPLRSVGCCDQAQLTGSGGLVVGAALIARSATPQVTFELRGDLVAALFVDGDLRVPAFLERTDVLTDVLVLVRHLADGVLPLRCLFGQRAEGHLRVEHILEFA